MSVENRRLEDLFFNDAVVSVKGTNPSFFPSDLEIVVCAHLTPPQNLSSQFYCVAYVDEGIFFRRGQIMCVLLFSLTSDVVATIPPVSPGLLTWNLSFRRFVP